MILIVVNGTLKSLQDYGTEQMGHPRVIYLWFYDTQMIGNDAETVMKMRKNHRDPHYVTTANKIAVKLKRDPLYYDY